MGREQLEHFRTDPAATGSATSWRRSTARCSHMKDEAANSADPNDRATLESGVRASSCARATASAS